MKYIINLIIVFDIDTRMLTLRNDNNLSTELSKPATRLLCELIKNNNTTLTRENIIKTVWVDYGYAPSSASLSNHISELRKAFNNLGLNKEIIITIPKTGFKLDADIHPFAKTKNNNSGPVGEVIKHEIHEPSVFTRIWINYFLKETTCRVTEHKSNIIIACSICVIILAGIVFFKWQKKEKNHQIAKIGECNIYELSNSRPPTDFITNAKHMIESEGVDCTHDATDIYYTNARPGNKLFNVHFMAVCRY
ncbi:winged helix-turn-helix domain-containing protein, partial [Citrobacter sp. Awk 4]|uniref:winged helix-turn-helix domain-containing protein n=1 Tax=Citrobacter sp. Awk 4 TaxID=2963955 RepID=UPI002302D8AE